jgi:hypothetical protein
MRASQHEVAGQQTTALVEGGMQHRFIDPRRTDAEIEPFIIHDRAEFSARGWRAARAPLPQTDLQLG